MLGLVLGARGFGCLTGIYGAIGRNEAITWDTIQNTGIVFYGGLIGMLLSYRLSLKISHSSLSASSMDILAVTIPLFHTIARIGCFLGGCCYGIVVQSPLSIIYTTDIMGTLSTAPRIPIQLIEAFINFIVFIFLWNLLKQNDWKRRHILRQYLLIYSIERFFLEFLRGDMNRGVIAGISFSQFVSIIIWLFLALNHKKEKRNLEEMYYESS